MDMELCSPFLDSLKSILMKMASVEAVTSKQFYAEDREISSKGVSSIISFNGKLKGRLLLDMGQSTALSLVKSITAKSFDTAKELIVLAAISELNNIIAGDGITFLNDKYFMELRLVPPIVFVGSNALICLDKIPSLSAVCTTKYGDVKINIAFEGSL